MDISSLSNEDVIRIKGSFFYETQDALNCKKTLENPRIKGNLKLTQGRHQCKTVGRVIFEHEGIAFRKCLCNFLQPIFGNLMVLHKHYEKGIMPFEGSLMDQPASIIEAMEIIEALIVQYKEKQAKEERNGNSQQSSGISPSKRRR